MAYYRLDKSRKTGSISQCTTPPGSCETHSQFDKFHLYLYGREFKIHTNHKSLIQVYGSQAKPLNARLERWLLSLQQYSFKIKYIPGWKNLADGLSRLPTHGSETEFGVGVEEYAYSVVMDSVPAAMTATQIERESAEDPLFIKVQQVIREDKCWKEELQNFLFQYRVTPDGESSVDDDRSQTAEQVAKNADKSRDDG